jgi:hypothetical protein
MFRTAYDFSRRAKRKPPVSSDSTPPTILTGPTVSAITTTTARVAWTLDEAGTGQVGYGLASPASGTPGTIAIVASDTRTGTSQYVSVPKSALALAAGDVVLIAMLKYKASSSFSQVSPTTGWTLMGNEAFTTDTDQQMCVAVKRISSPGSEPTNWEFDRGSNAYQDWAAISLLLRGVDPDTTLDVAIDVQEGTNDLTPDAPDITTLTDNALVVTGHMSSTNAANRADTVTRGAPSGFTLVGTGAVKLYAFVALAYKQQASAGAVSIGPWTHSPDNAVDDFQVFTLAIKPAPGGGVSGVRVADYDHQSAYEQNLLTSHSQNLAGLAASTSYHYMVESADAAGNVVTSADDTFSTTTGGGGTPGGFPTSQIGTSYVARPLLAEPGYLVEVKDPTFEGSITRISPDGQNWRNQYPKQQAWNADGSILACVGYGYRLLDGATYEDLGAMPSPPSSRLWWSWIDPTFMWWNSSNSNTFNKYWPLQGTKQVVKTFSGHAWVDNGSGEGRQSMDDRYHAFSTPTGALVWDAVTDTVVQATLPRASDINYVTMSLTGQYVQIRWSASGTGAGYGNWIYTRQLQPVRNANSTGHMDCALDEAGDDVVVGVSWPSSGIKAMRCADGRMRDVSFGFFGHVSGIASVNRPGWVYLSRNTTYNNAENGWDQIVCAKVDGSLEHQVWCHSRVIQPNATYVYAQSTHATPNRDGTKVVYGGGWNDTISNNSNNRGYVVRIAP